ncbi:dihydrofolate reductase [Labedella phragmitis]|uniref:Dihydrofolate reductase n=1 Tax=Labedella phragmitis TaxID=2498849 RepID=A0A444PUT9_9MICO|nr:dihydrofolate reductase [Labedella phragmitis]RWZ51639.1 dihydrofolate reductase [Labedella phragmitis]
MLGLIWAQARDAVIGRDGGMPWHVPEDMAHFKAVTVGTTVVMGRRTWESFPDRFRPLPHRRNIVLTRDAGWAADGAEHAASLDEALELTGSDDVWVIGGGVLYAEAIHRADVIELTELDLEVDGDTRAPAIGPEWTTVAVEPDSGWSTSRTGVPYRFLRLERTGA